MFHYPNAHSLYLSAPDLNDHLRLVPFLLGPVYPNNPARESDCESLIVQELTSYCSTLVHIELAIGNLLDCSVFIQ